MQFCPLDGCMVTQSQQQIQSEVDSEKYELTARELKKVEDNLIKSIETE